MLWIVDFSVGRQVCSSRQDFKETRRYKDKEIALILRYLSRLYDKDEGDVILVFYDEFFDTEGLCLSSEIRGNLISTYYLYEDGYHNIFLIECLF